MKNSTTRGRPKITPIKPVNKINQAIVKALHQKQGNDAVYEICKKVGTYAGTFRRTLETQDTWQQAIILYKACKFLGLDLKKVIEDEIKERG